jgi:putative ABC transport system permease protein
MRRLFLKLLRRSKLEADLEAELAFHREMAASHGNPIPLGNTALLKEQAFDVWRFNFIENLWRDLVYATRSLRRSPGFLLTALLSLGLGIGANTTIFSIAVEFLMSKPSVADASRVVSIRIGGNSHARPEVVDFIRRSGIFDEVVGENEETFINWNDGQETHRVFSVQTTKNYFAALKIPVAHGRGWAVNDPDDVVVLSHDFWRKHFGGDAAIVGRPIILDGRMYTVLGVLPESHRTLIGFGYSPDIYVPTVLKDTMLAIYARMKPGASFDEGRAALRVVAEHMDREMPQPWKYASRIQMEPLAGLTEMRNSTLTVGLFFALLLLLVFFVLLIACMNVASLLLVRASVRRQEIAIRLSLGASRGRLLQQLLAESLLLSILGATTGFLLARVVAAGLTGIPLPVPLPIKMQVHPDWRVASYAAALAIFSAVACALVPAWQSAKASLTSRMHRERRHRMGRSMVVGQIAVSVVLLAVGALFVRNLMMAAATSPGFDIRRTVRAEVHLPPGPYGDPKRLELYFGTALRELQSLPGVDAAAAARIVPFTDSTRFLSDLTFTDSGTKRSARFQWNAVSPDYFRVMDIPIIAGRAFNIDDRGLAKVVVVNRTFEQRYLDGRPATGKSFLWNDGKAPYRIVGVVAGTKNMTIGEDDQPQLYEPLLQIHNDRPRIQFVVRSSTPPVMQLVAIRQALRRVEPAAGLEVNTLFSSIGFAYLPSQIGAALMGGVGILGLLLAAIGLYGVTSYSVALRTREFGIRIAIGASLASIARMVFEESSRLVLIGSVIGLACGLLVAKPLTTFFVPGLSPADPVAFLAVVAILFATGFAASFGPVRRAMRVDPVASLRND